MMCPWPLGSGSGPDAAAGPEQVAEGACHTAEPHRPVGDQPGRGGGLPHSAGHAVHPRGHPEGGGGVQP